MVIVDTSVFSLFLRRNRELENPNPNLDLFLDLFEKDQVILLGVVYQELLSGLRHESQFKRLEYTLSGFKIEFANQDDHALAANFFNTCRSNGIQGSAIDFLICAMSVQRGHQILTLDKDFALYADHLPIQLLKI